MAHTDHVAEAIRFLEAAREQVLDEMQAELNRIDVALSSLRGTLSFAPTMTVVPVPRRTVKGSVQEVLESGPGPWKAPNIVATLQSRDDVPEVADLANAVRTSLTDLTKSGVAIRVGYGEYQATKWHTLPLNAEASGEPEASDQMPIRKEVAIDATPVAD